MVDRRLALLSVAVALVWAEPAVACRCAPVTAASAYRDADAVVLATVTRRREAASGRMYRFTVGESWKRRLTGPLTISLARDMCTPEFAVGGTYLVYLNDKPGGSYDTSTCSGNLTERGGASRLVNLRRRGRGSGR